MRKTDCFIPKGKNIDLMIDSLKSHIDNTDCNYMTIDISKLNLLEASKIAVECSTSHYLKYPQGRVDCKIKADNIKYLIKDLILGNMKFVI